MKKLLFILLLLANNAAFAQDIKNECNSKYSMVVLDEKTHNILLEKRADLIMYPASLTKLMTLYLTFEALEKHQLKSNQVLSISSYGEEVGNVNKVNSLHLKEGDKFTVREAIRMVIISSFNEAAVTLAEAISGSEWLFVNKMNAKAKELGMINTSFRNASGFYEDGQYTTAYDLARLALAIKRDFPGYYYLFSVRRYEYKKQKYDTHNHVLLEYKGAEGMKTGFTRISGYNLIAIAKKNNERLLSVLLGCESVQKRDNFTKNLLDSGFAAVKNQSKNNFKLGEKFDYDEDVGDKE